MPLASCQLNTDTALVAVVSVLESDLILRMIFNDAKGLEVTTVGQAAHASCGVGGKAAA